MTLHAVPKSFRGFRETGPRAGLFERWLTLTRDYKLTEESIFCVWKCFHCLNVLCSMRSHKLKTEGKTVVLGVFHLLRDSGNSGWIVNGT